jgi:predicted transposase/invertase (TIGR01784 family)
MINTEDKKFYVLSNDVIFKNTFNTKERLKKLLESILEVKIYDVCSLNTETAKTNKKSKGMVLDLVLDTNVGRINVELNNNSDDYISIRNLIYFFRLISMKLKTAENYYDIDMHTQINLTWGLQKYYNYDISCRDKIELYIADLEQRKPKYEGLFKIIDVNMDYYQKLCYDKNMKKEDKFLKFLSSKTEEELEENSRGDVFMEKVREEVKTLNADPNIIDEIYVEGEEQRMLNTERVLGIAEGEARGEARGKELGKEEGKAIGEKNKSIEIAKNMLSKNMDISLISEITSLTKEEIENLK